MRRLLASACLSLVALTPALSQEVGISAAVNQSARGLRPNAAVRTIVLGDNVVYNERIETDTVGLLQILLADGTTFTVGPNSALSIDRFVYDPNAGTAKVSATLTKGVFRFIGGKTSKTPGGVTLDTPVGTIGIRGAMADMNVGGGNGGAGPITAHFDLKYGKELTLDAPGGETQRIFEPGYSIIISKNPDGSEKREIRRTPPGLANEIQDQLSGAPGTSGGSSNQPTDQSVIVSGIATENSDRPPFVNDPPVPTARPSDGNEARPEEEIVQQASTDLAREEVVETIAETAVPTPRPDPVAPAAPIPPKTIPIRLATAGATYVSNSGDVVSNPGSVGLIGGSSDEDRLATLVQADGSASATATTNRGDLVVPVYADSAFTVRSIPLDGSASLGGVPLSGTLYSGIGGFAAYALGLDGDPTRPVYALAGTPLADASVFSTSDVRTYAFSRDMLQNLPVPFMRAGALDTDYSQASISDVYVVEGNGQGRAPRSFQSWLLIDGTGLSQKSGVGVNIGDLTTDGSGALQIAYGRRGSFRDEPLGFSSEFGGAVTTVAGPTGGNHFFGSNGEYFLFAGETSANDFFSDNDAFRTQNEVFSTTHILNLTSEISEAQFLSNRANGQALIANGGRTISGYATGLMEIGRSNGSYTQLLGTNDAGGGQFYIQFDASNNTIGGEFSIADVSRTNVMNVAFGNGAAGSVANGRSIYIDDDLFAAANNNDRNRNTVTQDANGTPRTYRQVQDGNPRTYVLSGDANPIPNFLPNGRLCDCNFLEWGWWGTQLTVRNNADPETIRAGVHLGTWVAGDVTTASQIASTVGQTATFNGGVVGNVSTTAAGGLADYVATGAMSMSYDFGARSGNMTITNFDQRNFAGAVSGTTGSVTQAEGVTGLLSQTNLAQDAQGSIEGLFVNDGNRVAAGLIGEINLESSSRDWLAVGVVAGSRP